jgi:hypothetical protein
MTLLTLAEVTEFRQTGRIDEVDALCVALTRDWPAAVRQIDYGRSAEGRILRALLASRAGVLSAQEIRQRKIPVLMIQAGIHPGESDGKDGGFIALQELLDVTVAGDALGQMALLFVPAFNTDGHERFGRWNRPNQNGPEKTGWRTTAQNLNLNRDYTKADTPEMQAMLRLIQEWDPLICADLHVTDGADFEPDVSIQAEPLNQGDPALRLHGRELRDALIARLAEQGSMPLDFYPDLVAADDPSSGFVLTVYSPRFSTGYFPQRNRFTVLVETHSWKPYGQRVRIMRNTIVNLAELTAAHGARWLEQTRLADEAASVLGGSPIALDYTSGWREPAKAGASAPTPALTSARPDAAGAKMIEFRGYAYTRTPSAISGGLVTAYNPNSPQIWRVPLRDQVKASLVVQAPRGGYLVPAAFAPIIAPKLELHGIAFEKWQRRTEGVKAAAFRADAVKFSAAPFEGRMRASLEGAWKAATGTIRPGDLYIPIAQPLSRLLLALLEPQAPDSFAAWGFFNASFEQKEQLEPYVAEQIAQDMLERSPDLRAEFARRLEQDVAFASDPSARLEFFLRRHTSWDERYNLYPVLRVETPLALQSKLAVPAQSAP